MKTRKILIAVGLVVVLVLGTVVVAGAEPAFGRLTGGGNWFYDVAGWAWGRMNVTWDPVTGEADGFLKYTSYTEEKPKNFGGWEGEVLCTAVGEYDGMPAVSLVVQVVEATYWIPGYYAKFIVADGGNEEQDWLGLSVWGATGPVPDHPGCEYLEPFYAWPVDHGNFTIHMP